MNLEQRISAYKSRQLFPDSEMRERKKPNETRLEKALVPIASKIVEAVFAGADELQEQQRNHPIASRERNYNATNLNALIIEHLIKAKIMKVTLKVSPYNNTLFELEGSLIAVKKLDNKFRPSYKETKSSKAYLSQHAIMDDERPFLYLGYQVNSQCNVITNIHLVYLCGESKVWSIDIIGLVSKENEKFIVNDKNYSTEPEVKVKIIQRDVS